MNKRMNGIRKMSIKEERQRRGWTQIDLSYHSRVPASELSKIETGRLKPSIGQLERIAKALGIRPSELEDSAIHKLTTQLESRDCSCSKKGEGGNCAKA